MSGKHVMYGWELSLYSGKTRAYLRYKGIDFVEKSARLWTFATLRKKTGAAALPVVVTPKGDWLQDTSTIMDRLEAAFPEAPVLPATPRQRLAALLLEAWGDEFWLPSAMHYRWNFPENFGLFEREVGANLLPGAPGFLQRRLAARPAALMRSYLPGLGVTPEQVPVIERWTTAMLDALEVHFTRHEFLLGGRPSYGDFGLIGPLYAHLGRDPYPKRELIAPRRNLAGWVRRMQHTARERGGEFLPNDEVPATLAPLLASVFHEFWPMLAGIQREVRAALPEVKRGHALRRSLGVIEFPMAGAGFRRAATPYSLWMAQRVLDAYASLDPPARASADAWLAESGGADAMKLPVRPRLARAGLRVIPGDAP